MVSVGLAAITRAMHPPDPSYLLHTLLEPSKSNLIPCMPDGVLLNDEYLARVVPQSLLGWSMQETCVQKSKSQGKRAQQSKETPLL